MTFWTWPKTTVSLENFPNWFKTLQKSHPLSICQFSNIYFKMRFFLVFLMECKLSEQFFPMKADACNVENMNIHHIKECFSPFSVTLIENRFCLVRTWSYTLLKNDPDSTDNSDSVSSFPMTNCCGFVSLWRMRTGCPVPSWGSFFLTTACCVFSWKKLDWNSCVSLKRLPRVVSFCHPSIHQLSTTLEKTKLCHRPTLSSALRKNFQ